MLSQKKLNKFCLYVGTFALVLFGLVYSVGEVKAAEIKAYEHMPVSGVLNYDDGSYVYYNRTFNYSFVASTTNITKFDTWLFRGDSSGGGGTYCGSDYNNCGANDYSVFYIYSDSDRTQLVASASLLWSSVQLCSDGNTSDFKCQAWVMANTQPATVFQFDEPVPLTLNDTYYVKITSGNYAGMGFKTWNSDYAYQAYYDDSWSASDDYVMYYGDNPVYTITGSNYDLPVVYDICDAWALASSTDEFHLMLVADTGNGVIEYDEQLLTSCSGSVRYSQLADVLVSNSSKFYIYKNLTSPAIVESADFLNVVYSDELDYIHYYYPNPTYIHTANATTSVIQFAYSICNRPDWANEYFNFRDDTRSPLYPDGIAYEDMNYIPLTCSGIGEMTLTYPQYGNVALLGNISLYRANDTIALDSNDIQFIFYSNTVPPVELDETTGIFRGVFTYLTDFLQGIFKPIQYSLERIFPFSIPVIIVDAWANSKDKPMPAQAYIFNALDDEGGISVNLPISNTPFYVFGANVLQTEDVTINFYSGVRSFSSIILWALFAFLLIFVAYKTFALLSGRDDVKFNQTPQAYRNEPRNSVRMTQTVRSKRGRGIKTFTKKL